MRRAFIIKVELDDWTAEELIESLKNQMPFSTENLSTIQVAEISVPTILKDCTTLFDGSIHED